MQQKESVSKVRRPVYQCHQIQPKTLFWELLSPGHWYKFDTRVDSTVNSPPKCTPSSSSESGLTHTLAPGSKWTTIRSSINVQLSSLLCFYVCVWGSLTEERNKKKHQPAEGGASQGSGQNIFRAGPEATSLIWELSKCPSKPPASVRAGAKTQGLYSSRTQAVPATNLMHYSPLLMGCLLSKPISVFLAIFSAYSTALIW